MLIWEWGCLFLDGATEWNSTISTAGSDFDTVWPHPGTCSTGSCDDDAGGDLSSLISEAVEGQEYEIIIGGYSGRLARMF